MAVVAAAFVSAFVAAVLTAVVAAVDAIVVAAVDDDGDETCCSTYQKCIDCSHIMH